MCHNVKPEETDRVPPAATAIHRVILLAVSRTNGFLPANRNPVLGNKKTNNNSLLLFLEILRIWFFRVL